MVDVDALLAALTTEEKAALTAGADLVSTVGVERLVIPKILLTDGRVEPAVRASPASASRHRPPEREACALSVHDRFAAERGDELDVDWYLFVRQIQPGDPGLPRRLAGVTHHRSGGGPVSRRSAAGCPRRSSARVPPTAHRGAE